MDQAIRYHGTVSWQLYRRAQWRHFGARWLALFTFPVLMKAYDSFTSRPLAAATLVTVFVISTAFVPIMVALMMLQSRRTYAKSPYLHEPLVGSVSTDKFIVEGSTGRTEMTWDRFV